MQESWPSICKNMEKLKIILSTPKVKSLKVAKYPEAKLKTMLHLKINCLVSNKSTIILEFAILFKENGVIILNIILILRDIITE